MADLTPELFAKIKAIQIRTRRLVTDVMAGEYESAFKGRGMEFEQVREYQAGDDVRHIDWNVTARMGAPFIKEHREERELTVMLLVDVSSSGAFGSVRKVKNEIAAEVAAVLAYTAIKSHDRVGLVIFSDRIEHVIPPKKGRAHVWQVIRDILTFEPARRGTDLDRALDYLGRIVRRRAVVFLISDFVDASPSDRLRAAAKRHDVTAVTVTDPREVALPDVGLVEFEDAETGEIVLVDTSLRAARDGFARRGVEACAARQRAFREASIGEIEVHTDRSIVDPIVRYFHGHHRSH